MRRTKKKLLSVMLTAAMTVSLIPQLPVTTATTAYAGDAVTTITNTKDYYSTVSKSRVSVHDPSIVVGKDASGKKCYYIFGSHMAWAKSYDLVKWTTFTNNIKASTLTSVLPESVINWSAAGDSVYDIKGNMWAPDVIWNEAMGKWCMYMSVNGCSWNSSIILLTADELYGDWTYVDTVVYSGFTDSGTHTYTATDYAEVTGDTSLPSRYSMTAYSTKDGNTACEPTTWNKSYGPHAIDPCVFYDEDGNMWMSYGSWSGGIYIFQLDKNTGLRDTTKKYTYDTSAKTDPYFGKRLGGSGASGEASYIQYIDGYYYMFVSYGGLVANGGYNMRVFRSENPDGPYVDYAGKEALSGGATNGSIGTRLMSYYKWSWQTYAQVAQGHNSAFVDEDGKAYVIYHTRTNDGTEGHSVRVHQLFTTEDNGYIVAAPFEYNTTDATSATTSETEIAGTYEILFQYNTASDKLEYNEPQVITLNEDKTITGEKTGTWDISRGEDCTYITLTIGAQTYKGVFVTQTMEGTDVKTLAFSSVGSDDVYLWGAKYPSDDVAVAMATDLVKLETTNISEDIKLPDKGLFGADITWKSNCSSILSDGTVIQPVIDRQATLTATVSKGNYICNKDISVTVKAKKDPNAPTLLGSYYTSTAFDLSSGKTASVANPLLGQNISNGVSIKFKATRTGTFLFLSNILSFETVNTASGESAGRLYFTGGSYLGYNATGDYYDANVDNSNWVAGTDFIGKDKEVQIEIKLTPSGYEVYADGTLAYDNTMVGTTIKGANNITNFSNVLTWLSENATYLNFGFGSWWTDKFKGTIKDVEIWAEPVPEKILGSNYIYLEDYEENTVINAGWTCHSALTSEKVSDNDGLVASFTSTGSGHRSGKQTLSYTAEIPDEYYFITDVYSVNKPTGGSSNPTTQIAIVGADNTTSATSNREATGDLLLNLVAAGTASSSPTQTYVINGGSESVTMDSGKWYNIRLDVVQSTKKATLTVTNKATEEVAYTGTYDISENTEPKGIYVLAGRGGTNVRLDNTIIGIPGIADYEALDKAVIEAKKYIKVQELYSIYSDASVNALKAAVEEAEAISRTLDVDQQEQIDVVTAKVDSALAGLVCVKHEYNNGVVTKKPTCTEKGTVLYTCYNCGHHSTSEVNATGHKLVKTSAKAATCTLAGNIEYYKCSVCQKYFSDAKATKQITLASTVINAKGHTYKTAITKATTTQNGSIVTKCACGSVKSRTIIYRPKTIVLSKTSYTYDGKAKKPTVTVKDSAGKVISKTNYTVSYSSNVKPGTAKVTVKFKNNYSGQLKKTFKIALAKPAIKSVKASGSKKIKVTLKAAVKNVKGYEIQYSTSKSFAKSKTKTATITSNKTKTKTISKLKAKTKYYVRVRSYIKIGSKKYVSAWVKYGKATKTK